MKAWKMCLMIFSVIVVYNSSKYYEAWTNYELEKLEIQRKADKDKYNALLKTASTPVFQKYVTEKDFQIAMATFKEQKENVEKNNYRPLRNEIELENLLHQHREYGDSVIASVILLKAKISEAKFITTITGIEVLPTVDSQIYSIFLGNGNVYSFEDLFENFEIFVDGQYQPFGVKSEQ